MWLLRKYEQLRVFIPEMQSEADAIFALNNGAVIAGQKNWTQVRAAVLTMDRDWLDLKERFSITDEFVEQHREPVTNFLLRGGRLFVTWDRTKNKVLLTGPAETVFEGTLAERI